MTEKNGKCTFVTKYGLQEAIERLDKVIQEAIDIIDKFGTNGEFLKHLAIYIKDREK